MRPPNLSPRNHAEWFAALDRIEAGVSAHLLAFLEDCRDLHITWALKDVFTIRLNANGKFMQIFGVEKSGDVVVPWMILGHKEHCRTFTHQVADAIPGAAAHESAKMWNVSKPGEGRISVLELLQASETIKSAIEGLSRAVRSYVQAS